MDTEFRKHSNQGFTMAELLIVVAIIAVLVAIAIPVFASQLEKSREAVDLSNVRSAYGAYQISVLNQTAPDGGQWGNGDEYYIYTSSGTFVKRTTNSPVPDACRLTSKSADFSDIAITEIISPDPESGWKDYVIVATNFFENNGYPAGKVLTLMPW